MAARIGLMGLGRIGRNLFRILHGRDDIKIVAIADIAPPEALAYLIQYDTVHGKFSEKVRCERGEIHTSAGSIPVLGGRKPSDVDWSEHEVDYVIEATNRYRTRPDLDAHLQSGVHRVLLASPPATMTDVDRVHVPGIPAKAWTKDDRRISLGSCTLHAVAPVLRQISQAVGIRQVYLNSAHAYSNRLRLADVPAADLRSSRAAAENIIPNDSYTPHAIGTLLPELAGRLQGMALNVPVSDGSCVDLTVFCKQSVQRESINAHVEQAAAGELSKILAYTEEPIVSSDAVGDPHSGIFDGLATLICQDELLKVLIWYDNGWGYAHRTVELIEEFYTLDGGQS